MGIRLLTSTVYKVIRYAVLLSVTDNNILSKPTTKPWRQEHKWNSPCVVCHPINLDQSHVRYHMDGFIHRYTPSKYCVWRPLTIYFSCCLTRHCYIVICSLFKQLWLLIWCLQDRLFHMLIIIIWLSNI